MLSWKNTRFGRSCAHALGLGSRFGDSSIKHTQIFSTERIGDKDTASQKCRSILCTCLKFRNPRNVVPTILLLIIMMVTIPALVSILANHYVNDVVLVVGFAFLSKQFTISTQAF